MSFVFLTVCVHSFNYVGKKESLCEIHGECYLNYFLRFFFFTFQNMHFNITVEIRKVRFQLLNSYKPLALQLLTSAAAVLNFKL